MNATLSGIAAAGSIEDASDRVLEPGAASWRLARADRLALVIDAVYDLRAW